MLSLRRAPRPPSPRVDDGSLACYVIAVSTASLLLFTVLAATAGIVKACALAGAACVAFTAAGCASRRCAGDGGGAAHALPTAVTPTPAPAARASASPACGLVGAAIDALPAFAYMYARPGGAEARSGGEGEGDGGGGSKSGRRRALCAVCLEDVEAGEMVRRLPACGHLFHVGCIDMWLHSHATCPLCRSDVSPRQIEVKAVAAPATADAPDGALPPV